MAANALRKLHSSLDLLDPEIAEDLYAQSLITSRDKEKIDSKDTSSKKASTILTLLARRNPKKALQGLIKALEKNKEENEEFLKKISEVYPDYKFTLGQETDWKDLAVPPILNVTMEAKESTDPFGHELGMYPIVSNPRGYCLIINNLKFDKSDPRPESANDAKELISLFRYKLGFFVEYYTNLTSEKMVVLMRNAQGADHSSLSCFVLGILSHGGEHGEIYGTDDKPVLVKDIANFFTGDNCRTLKDKPKIFIFGACRGPYYDPGVTIEEPDGGKIADQEEDEAIDGAYTIPAVADMLFIYPTPPGFQSWKWESGSWFIQSFVRAMRKHAHKIDILGILTETNRIVSEEYKSRVGEMKMMPVITSAFRYKLYLPPIS